jgi:hypothetical protein
MALALTAALSITVLGAAPAQAAPGTLKLFAQNAEITVRHRDDRGAYLNSGVFAAAVGGDFEIHANRADYASPIVGSQWADGAWVQDIDPALMNEWYGFVSFFHVQVKNPAGNVIIDQDLDWCPVGWNNERVDDSGPDVQRMPFDGCYAMPFARGTVMGIDQGWATPVSSRYGGIEPVYLGGREGTYRVTYSFPQNVIDEFGFDPDHAVARVTVHLESGRHRTAARAERPAASTQDPAPRVPTDPTPDPSIVPDLIPTPAWSMRLNRPRSGGEFLAFASNIWNAGPSPMVVEGFRRPDSDVMDAYEYFYDGDTPVSRAPVGTFEFDRRHGHHHWHMDQFVQYDLLNADQSEIVRSTKQSFCLVPTDAIDLTVPNADWRPDYYGGGLGTACGGSDAIWIREVLPVGWGDTYYQYVAGQSFPVKGLPNGRYYIRITANPTGEMIEASTDNNVSLRRVVLRGTPGHRRVIVPPYQLIDSDGCRFC